MAASCGSGDGGGVAGIAGGETTTTAGGAGQASGADTTGGSTDATVGPLAGSGVLGLVGADLSPDAEACIATALAGDPGLAEATASGSDISALTETQQATVSAALVECVPQDELGSALADSISEGLDPTSPQAMSADVERCFAERMTGNSGQEVVLGFLALDADQPLPPGTREPVLDTLVTCIPGPVLVGFFTADPETAGAFDAACLETTYSNVDNLRSFWAPLVDNPGAEFDTLPPDDLSQIMNPILGCMRFGALVAQEFEGSVQLSEATIACIDEAFSSDPAVAQALITGSDPPPSFEAALIACLTPEELLAIGQ